MVKKSIIAIAVLALLVTTVHAGSPAIKKDGDWPWTYKSINLCTMPVFMEVGHYVQLKDCQDRKIELVQVDCTGDRAFPCYSDCETIEVRANFPAIFGATLAKDGPIITDYSIYWDGDDNQINGSTGDWETLKVCLDTWNTEIWKAATAVAKIQVGTLTINVKPPDGP
ncbi:MAG: hypothetical protein HQ580_03045 [Planctomycetes bacterium]|nr:hypothetical protein [Planctomycetota bacterium]